VIEFEVDEAEHGMRLDVVLARRVPEMTRKKAREMIDADAIRVNAKHVQKSHPVSRGDRVMLSHAPPPTDFEARPDPEMQLSLVYEDPWIVCIDKPAGVPSHPLRADELGTVTNALVARFPEMRGVGYSQREPGIVHRLDTNTSGLMLAARDPRSFETLRRALSEGRIEKRYHALVLGSVDRCFVIDLPIAPHPRDPKRVTVGKHIMNGAAARTEITRVEPHGDFTLVLVSASHATRHQVRAHLSAIGHPLVGDVLYGGPEIDGLSRHFLHASQIELTHPADQDRRLRLTSSLPDELRRLLHAKS
jgi:23S rRNA pseudouridine1911/1915/1917 synthase